MRCISRFVCAIAALTVTVTAYACFGSFDDGSNIWYFKVTDSKDSDSDGTKRENLLLWQQETSADIRLSDIEAIVYGDFDAQSWDESAVSKDIRANGFYRWIRKEKATYIEEFLTFAKRVERSRAEKCSPWYYPAERVDSTGGDGGFATLIETCWEHSSGKLRTRYGLQMMRLLHASCQYEECVAVFNRWFSGVDDSDLMKRMSMRYVAGSLLRLGEVDKANEYFAIIGDYESITGTDAVAYMAEVNPTACPLEKIELSLFNALYGSYSVENIKQKILPVAYKVLKDGKAQNIGEWEFLVAYIEGEYNGDYQKAKEYIYRALKHGLSTEIGRDHVRAYKMAVDAETGNVAALLADIKWLERKVKEEENWTNMLHWRHLMLGTVYKHWFTYLTEHNKIPMAILLSNYVENTCGYVNYDAEEASQWFLSPDEKERMRASREDRNAVDFSGRLVEFMLTLRAQDIIDYKRSLNDDSKLVAYLRDNGRNDEDFLNEIIGTLLLRGCNYFGAYNWLQKVSPEYQYTLNTYKEGYLARNPFSSDYESRLNVTESKKAFPKLQDDTDIKLKFARAMCRLEWEMRNGKNGDARALATIKYSLGRYASFSTCWALTSYSKGSTWPSHYVYPDKMQSPWSYDDYDWYEEEDEESLSDRRYIEEELMKKMVERAVASIKSDDAAAEAQYLIGNLKTVVKRYPDTQMGELVRSSCDNWKDWI